MPEKKQEKIEEHRNRIDEINTQIIELIAERVDVAKKLGKIKENNNMSIRQKDREAQVVQLCKKKADSLGLNPDHIGKVFEKIIQISREAQIDE